MLIEGEPVSVGATGGSGSEKSVKKGSGEVDGAASASESYCLVVKRQPAPPGLQLE